MVSFTDDMTVILPPELSLDMAALEKATGWLQERLGAEGILLKGRKLQALLADGVGRAKTSDGRAACGDGCQSVYGGPTGDG